MKYSNKT